MDNETIHVLATSNGSPYQNIQTRIMYGSFLKVQSTPLGKQRLKGFTRILHRTQPDNLMDEVPTFQASPLNPKCDEWCEFPVADRPDAVRQWLDHVEEDPTTVKGTWLLMLETDYVFAKVPDLPTKISADGEVLPVSFPFHYIQPTAKHLEPIIREMYTEDLGPVTDIQPTGPAPVLINIQQLTRLILDWVRLTDHIESSPAAKEALGWRPPIVFSLDAPPASILTVQPPNDEALGAAALYHYTWGAIISNAAGEKIWSFDKRDYTAEEHANKPPKLQLLPPFEPGWKLQDGKIVSKELYYILDHEITLMNEVISGLPQLSS
ncbi:hypothetical protein WJX84_004875 [Apatococcus fuscideae]